MSRTPKTHAADSYQQTVYLEVAQPRAVVTLKAAGALNPEVPKRRVVILRVAALSTNLLFPVLVFVLPGAEVH